MALCLVLYLDDLTALFRWLRASGWGLIATLTVVAVALIGLLLFYEPLP